MIIGIAVAVRPGEAKRTPPACSTKARGPTLTRFASAEAFERYVGRAAARAPGALETLTEAPPAPEMPLANAAAKQMGIVFDVAEAPANPEITNNQTIGVDEGGIVKQIDRFLVRAPGRAGCSAPISAPARARRCGLADRIDVYRNLSERGELV